jgi:hypothetical protein
MIEFQKMMCVIVGAVGFENSFQKHQVSNMTSLHSFELTVVVVGGAHTK